MAEPAKIDLTTVKRGDTYIVDFYFSDTDGTKDISAVTIDAQARREMDGALWFDLKPVKVDASNGHFRIHLTHDETRDITESPPGSFSGIFDIQFSWQGANEVYVSTIVAGSISISKDVTQPTKLMTSGSSPMVPPSSQEVNVYLSLNPGSPNYSDVVTAEQLTPVQYDLSASLGLANVNAINEAGESAKIAKAAAAEAVAAKNEARQSATLATMQATKATNEADRAKSEADKAKQVSGLDTVDQAVDMAMAEFAGMMSETERNAILRMNEAKYDASGMVHMGRTAKPAASTAIVNEGIYSWVAATNENNLRMGRSPSGSTNQYGTSKSLWPVVHIAGVVSNILDTRSTYAFAFELPPAPDGTDIYDSTGDCRGSGKASLNLKTDIDPKYGNVPTGSEAQILREAVSRAFEGEIRNGDFRESARFWSTTGAVTIDTTGAQFTADGNDLRLRGNLPLLKENDDIELEFVSDTAGSLNIYIYGIGSDDQNINYQAVEGVNRIVSKGADRTGNYGTDATVMFRNSSGTFGGKLSNISIRKVTEGVVTHPVDGIFIESYDEELTGRVEIMENIQSLSTTFGTTSVPTVLSTRKLSYFQQYDGQFPEVAINPDFINDRYRCVVWTDLTEPQKREIAAYMGEKLFMGVNGFPVNTRNRARTIRGLGNGDWNSTDVTLSGGNYALAYSDKAFINAQGKKDVGLTPSGGWTTDTYFTPKAGSQDNPEARTGVFSPRTSSNLAYKDRCFMYLVATVPRANQGAYHEKLNPWGTAVFRNNSVTDGSSWYNPWYNKWSIALGIHSTEDCFNKLNTDGSTGINGGDIASGRSGHPDGIYFDGIEAGGLNGVIDWRLGAVANDSPEEAAKVEAKVENGTYRGLEKLVWTDGFVDTTTSQTHPSGVYLSSATIPTVSSSHNGEQTLIINGIAKRGIFYWYSSTCIFYPHDGVGASVGQTVKAVLSRETNLSVSGEFSTQMVIGDPANILLTDALKDGWLGTWCPVIPDGTSKFIPLTRENVGGDPASVYTSDNGVTWSSGTRSNFDSVTNGDTVGFGVTEVQIWSYKAFAKQTKPTTVKPILNATKGLLGVTVTQSHDKAVLAEAVAGIILKSGASGIVTEQSQSVKYLVDGTIKRLKTLTSDMVAPTNSSQAIKIAVYQISNNGQTSLAIIANTMTHNGTSWGELEEIKIPSSGSGTFPDGNNITQQAFCTELSIPTGWTSNIARVGTQVPGVDL
ncbi:hypothetical protein SIPHO067v1_p0049 [Vibrio phage 51E28.1]|nr:hypothetical protein SIPHO067v1_p0049 [Vibrio phage 51E28.1]